MQDADENKLCYTQVFQDYQAVVERSLEQRLSAAIPDFSMDTFIAVRLVYFLDITSCALRFKAVRCTRATRRGMCMEASIADSP